MEKFPITVEGFAKINDELENLKKVERPTIIQAISEAREMGDLSENAEYHSAKEKQSFIEGRILELEDKIARAEVINVTKLSGKDVKFGATITLIDEETDEEATYQIVGEYESDFSQGKISIASPIARALIGKKEGDSVEFNSPKGIRYFEILKVKY